MFSRRSSPNIVPVSSWPPEQTPFHRSNSYQRQRTYSCHSNGKDSTERDTKLVPVHRTLQVHHAHHYRARTRSLRSRHLLFILYFSSGTIPAVLTPSYARSQHEFVTCRVCDQPSPWACRQGVSMDAPSKNFMVDKEGGRKA